MLDNEKEDERMMKIQIYESCREIPTTDGAGFQLQLPVDNAGGGWEHVEVVVLIHRPHS